MKNIWVIGKLKKSPYFILLCKGYILIVWVENLGGGIK